MNRRMEGGPTHFSMEYRPHNFSGMEATHFEWKNGGYTFLIVWRLHIIEWANGGYTQFIMDRRLYIFEWKSGGYTF